MNFPIKTRNIMIGISILSIVLIPFIIVGVLPFFLFPIILLISMIIQCYIAYKWIRWKNQVNKRNSCDD